MINIIRIAVVEITAPTTTMLMARYKRCIQSGVVINGARRLGSAHSLVETLIPGRKKVAHRDAQWLTQIPRRRCVALFYQEVVPHEKDAKATDLPSGSGPQGLVALEVAALAPPSASNDKAKVRSSGIGREDER